LQVLIIASPINTLNVFIENDVWIKFLHLPNKTIKMIIAKWKYTKDSTFNGKI